VVKSPNEEVNFRNRKAFAALVARDGAVQPACYDIRRDNSTGGFPSGTLRLSECIGLPNEATCGLTASSGFNKCIPKIKSDPQYSVNLCLRYFTSFAGLRACDHANPCRDDYICIRPFGYTNNILFFSSDRTDTRHHHLPPQLRIDDQSGEDRSANDPLPERFRVCTRGMTSPDRRNSHVRDGDSIEFVSDDAAIVTTMSGRFSGKLRGPSRYSFVVACNHQVVTCREIDRRGWCKIVGCSVGLNKLARKAPPPSDQKVVRGLAVGSLLRSSQRRAASQ
jgi:hypothetical protein